jgi:phospholipase/carboxylesterase
VLEETPGADLSGAKILMVVGEHDVFGAHAAGLEADLRAAGAEIDTLRIDAGHETGPLDIEAVRSWLAGFRAA